jgi:hypothetical protein
MRAAFRDRFPDGMSCSVCKRREFLIRVFDRGDNLR